MDGLLLKLAIASWPRSLADGSKPRAESPPVSLVASKFMVCALRRVRPGVDAQTNSADQSGICETWLFTNIDDPRREHSVRPIQTTKCSPRPIAPGNWPNQPRTPRAPSFCSLLMQHHGLLLKLSGRAHGLDDMLIAQRPRLRPPRFVSLGAGILGEGALYRGLGMAQLPILIPPTSVRTSY